MPGRTFNWYLPRLSQVARYEVFFNATEALATGPPALLVMIPLRLKVCAAAIKGTDIDSKQISINILFIFVFALAGRGKATYIAWDEEFVFCERR